MKIYSIEDDKYGTQAIFEKEEDAERALKENYNKYCIGGMGACIIEWDLK
jgi:hypothetical protein